MKREKMLRRLSVAQFAMWETRVYLDTHSCDKTAKEMYKEYEKKYLELKKQFEQEFGPLTVNAANSDEWLKNPWPWDFSAGEEDDD